LDPLFLKKSFNNGRRPFLFGLPIPDLNQVMATDEVKAVWRVSDQLPCQLMKLTERYQWTEKR